MIRNSKISLKKMKNKKLKECQKKLLNGLNKTLMLKQNNFLRNKKNWNKYTNL